MRNGLGILMCGKSALEPTFAYDIDRIHSLMIYTDLVEYNFARDTQAPLLRCFPFISKLKSVDIITTRQYMNYQTFSNLQFTRKTLLTAYTMICKTRLVRRFFCLGGNNSTCSHV